MTSSQHNHTKVTVTEGNPLDKSSRTFGSGKAVAEAVRTIIKAYGQGFRVSRADRARAAGVDLASYNRWVSEYRPSSFVYLYKVAASMNLSFARVVSIAEGLVICGEESWIAPKSNARRLRDVLEPDNSKQVEQEIILQIKSISAGKGISQSELARRTGCNRSSISRLGRVSNDHSFILLYTISTRGLGIPFSSLVKTVTT